jgi:hypothetical protein
MRRHRSRMNVKDYSYQAMKNHVIMLMNNRWRLLTPPPLTPDELWDAVLNDEQRRAIELLTATMPSVFSLGTQVFFSWDLPIRCPTLNSEICYTPSFIEATLPHPRPIPNTNLRWIGNQKLLVSDLPVRMQKALCEWAPRWAYTKHETNCVLAKIDALFATCNTMGHIKRLWPSVATMLPERAQNKLREAKGKSPYPESALDLVETADGHVPPRLKPEWEPKELEWFDDRLTEAMCMPLEYDLAAGQRWPVDMELRLAI